MNPLKLQNRKSSESKEKEKKSFDNKASDRKHDSKEDKKEVKKDLSKEEKGEKRDDKIHSSEKRNGKEDGKKLEHGTERKRSEKVCRVTQQNCAFNFFLSINRDLAAMIEAEHALGNPILEVNMIVVCLQKVNMNAVNEKF